MPAFVGSMGDLTRNGKRFPVSIPTPDVSIPRESCDWAQRILVGMDVDCVSCTVLVGFRCSELQGGLERGNLHVLCCEVCRGLTTPCPGELRVPQEAEKGCSEGCPQHGLIVARQDAVLAESQLQPEEQCWGDWLPGLLWLLPLLALEALEC